MEIQNNSLIDTIIDYANVKFGIEMPADQAKEQFLELSFDDTLKLIEIIRKEDDESFSNMIDLSIGESGYGVAGTLRGQSAATNRKQQTFYNQQQRREKRAAVKRDKDSRQGGAERGTAGANKSSTGTRSSKDPDDQQRNSNSSQAAANSAEINRLKQLLSRR